MMMIIIILVGAKKMQEDKNDPVDHDLLLLLLVVVVIVSRSSPSCRTLCDNEMHIHPIVFFSPPLFLIIDSIFTEDDYSPSNGLFFSLEEHCCRM